MSASSENNSSENNSKASSSSTSNDNTATATTKTDSLRILSSKEARELLLKSKSGETLSLEERILLVRSVGEECTLDSELANLIEKKTSKVICYDGFEPSGRMHIAQGLFKSINVNKCTAAGCHFVFWVADWFAMLNNKMGGDLKKIRIVGEYMIEVWKACGMNMENVEFRWASDTIEKDSGNYWVLVMNIARSFTLPRVTRCSQIMGRSEQVDMPASQILYPCMQAADIFHLKADICQLGMDQRKVNMLAREYCTRIKRKLKPVVLSHHMLMGLGEGQEKMSKSDPNSAIFMEDQVHEVNSKIKRAFCPPGVVEKNPCLDYMKHIVFNCVDKVEIKRKDSNGGDVTYNSYQELEDDFAQEKLHPGDLKVSLRNEINALLQPVRDHFKKNQKAKKLLAQVRKFRVTR